MTKSALMRAHLMIETFENAIRRGNRHYRKSDGQLLTDVASILEALRDEGEVRIEGPEDPDVKAIMELLAHERAGRKPN